MQRLDISLPAIIRTQRRLRDLPGMERPRERLVAQGPDGLTMSELVAVLLGTGTKREEVMSMSARVLDEYGGLAVAQETSPRRLAEALQIPLNKACQLIAGFELGRRFYQTSAGKPVVIRTARQAHAYLHHMGDQQKELLQALYLGSRHQLIHEEIISVGCLTANLVHPREVFRPAVQYNAASVIIAHNHPSGELEPSQADKTITYQLVSVGTILSVPLIDHLIISGTQYISMFETTDIIGKE
jgi:DNA repair protein RadC